MSWLRRQRSVGRYMNIEHAWMWLFIYRMLKCRATVTAEDFSPGKVLSRNAAKTPPKTLGVPIKILRIWSASCDPVFMAFRFFASQSGMDIPANMEKPNTKRFLKGKTAIFINGEVETVFRPISWRSRAWPLTGDHLQVEIQAISTGQIAL